MRLQYWRGAVSHLWLVFTFITGINATCNVAGAQTSRTTVQDFSDYFLRPGDPLFVYKDERPKDGALKVTFLGNSTLLFDDGATQLLVDGFLTRPTRSEVLGQRISTNTVIVDDSLRAAGVDNSLRALFVSHSHYDHALDAAYIVQKYPLAVLYGSTSTMMIGLGGGLSKMAKNCVSNPTEGQRCEFGPDDEFTVGAFRVKVLKSKHSPPTPLNNDLDTAINAPLRQPARYYKYKEGSSFDFLIHHGAHRILVKPGANYVEPASPHFFADVLFLGTGRLVKQHFNKNFNDRVYAETVTRAHPRLVVPIHWDDFLQPLSEPLQFPSKLVDDSAGALEFLIRAINQSNAQAHQFERITFRMLQGYQSIMLFRNCKDDSRNSRESNFDCTSMRK